MAVEQTDGWTVVTPSADSRIVYIAAESSGGNDASAAAVYGRGYYLPSDPEIGNDPTQPVGEVVAYRNPQEALKVLRGTGASSVGAPEWILFRRGDTFPNSIMDGNYCYWSGGPTFTSIWTWAWGNNLQRNSSCGEPRWGSAFSYAANGGGGNFRGRNETEPFVISAWGNPSEPRPIFPNKFGITPNMWNSVISSLDMQGGIAVGNAGNGAWTNTTVEDCFVLVGLGGFHISGGSSSTNLIMRRCVFTGGFNPSGHNSAPFVGLAGGASLTFEECIFDHNGFKENPFDPSSWSAKSVSSSLSSVGEGVQPRRTFYDRNIYVGTGNGENHVKFVLRGSIISRNGGGGSVQMRQGGISEKNVFMWNEDIGNMICGPGGIFSKNLVLHDDHMRPPGGWGLGLNINNSETWNNEGKGWSLETDPRYIVEDSVFAHFHRGSNGGGMLEVFNTSTKHQANGSNLGTILNGRIKIMNNAIHRSQSSGMRLASYGTWDDVVIGGNQVAITNGTLFSSEKIHLTSVAEKGSLPYSIGNSSSGGNLYWSQSATPFGNRTFSEWKSLREEFETESQFLSDFDSFKSIAGWTAPEKDIVSYMQSIDPTYIPNEDVTTDDGVPVDKRRPEARLVRDVLRDPEVGGYSSPFWGDSEGMTENRSKLIARRYHAFLTFMERAKSNRKGEWNSAYTADALNNYIREGFGKSRVSGDYDNRNVDTRTLEYFSEHGSVESLVLITQPIGNVSGQPLKIQPRIALRDASNTNVSSDNTTQVSVSLIQSVSNGTLSGTTTVTVVNGVATFTDLVLTGTGDESYVLRFSISSPELSIDSTPLTVFQCQALSITPTSETISAIGGTGSISFSNASAICSWEAVSDSSWLTMIRGSTGTGESALIIYNVDKNPSNFSRVGTITLDDSNQISIIQEGFSIVETENHVHKIKGSYSGQIERVFNKDYFLDLSVPVDRTITRIVAETSEGSCILELYKNNDQITQIPASTIGNSITLSSNNIVSTGDRLKIQINTNNRVRELKFSVHYEQRSEMNI